MLVEEIKEFIRDYYKYTTTISITEDEYFEKFEHIENGDCQKVSYQDLLYNFIFYQNNIKEQIEIDLNCFGTDTEEYKYIKEFYNKYKKYFNFKIEELEK